MNLTTFVTCAKAIDRISIMKQIKLTRGHITLVDDDDFEWLNQYKWHVDFARNGRKYAVRMETRNGKRCYVAMHREILGLKNRLEYTDHRDNDGLNNQRYNLRRCTCRQNLANQPPRKGRRFKGVYCYDGKRKTSWTAFALGKYLGSFPTELEAVKAYNNELQTRRGDFARLNR